MDNNKIPKREEIVEFFKTCHPPLKKSFQEISNDVIKVEKANPDIANAISNILSGIVFVAMESAEKDKCKDCANFKRKTF